MSALTKAKSQAEQASKSLGINLTPKRMNLFSLLLNSKTPLSAYELAQCYKENFGDSVPPMSIYRMLDFLTENNMAHKLSSENKFIGCSHVNCDHAHGVPQFLICETCHEVKEIEIKKEVFDILNESVNQADFVLKQTQLELRCLCAKCAELSK